MTIWKGGRVGALGLLMAALAAGCGKGDQPPAEAPATPDAGAEAPLSAFELEHGIGPVKEPVTLGAIDPVMADSGEEIFELKCAACHKMETKYVGPALGDVTTRRSPAYIMNMILNPMEMVERHPVAKQLLAEHMTFMANQNLTREEAREVLEYLRTRAKGTPQN